MEDEKKTVSSSAREGTFWIKVERMVSIGSIFANLATVAGIFFVIWQIQLSNTLENRRVAIEAVRQTRTSEFIKAFRQAKLASQTGRIDEKDKDALTDSVNHVMNVYDDIAVIYTNDIADKCIIKESIYSAAKEWSVISKTVSSSTPEDRKHFDKLLQLMEPESCDNKYSV
jgi:hypothetical protein